MANEAQSFAGALLKHLSQRVDELENELLKGCLWAIAKIDARSRISCDFAAACIRRLNERSMLDLSLQSLCQCVWSLAKLHVHLPSKEGLCLQVLEEMLRCDPHLQGCAPCELSMAAWGTAHIFNHRCRKRLVVSFIGAVATAATERISEFGVQSLSNVAWAVGKLQTAQKASPGRRFLGAVALECSGDLERWSPQAVSNVCFALARAEGSTRAFESFGMQAMQAAMSGAKDFQWQDLASVATAARHLNLQSSPQLHHFLTWLVLRASQSTTSVSTRPLLNIAIAAWQVLGPSPSLQHLILLMRSDLSQRALNEADKCQWQQLQCLVSPSERPKVKVSLVSSLL
jgi:hypothetical protein